jgi:hypothetical protein
MSEQTWIPCAERSPTEADAVHGRVWFRDIRGDMYTMGVSGINWEYVKGYWCRMAAPPDFVPPKRLAIWLNVYPNDDYGSWPTREEADRHALPKRIRCVRMVEQMP